MSYTQVDLGGLPAPDILEPLSIETILQQLKDSVTAIHPGMAPVLQIEGEPAVKVLEVCAVFIFLTRARVNDAARGLMLTFARGTDLDHLGALFGVERFSRNATEDDPGYVESDDDFRFRIQISLEGFSTAGPRGAYEFHARSAHPDVKDVMVAGPGTDGLSVAPGDVEVYVLSHQGNGTAAQEVLDEVARAVNDERVRPLTDRVLVYPAAIRTYQVRATIEVVDGTDLSVVEAAARAALDDYLAAAHYIGATVARSGIMAALHQPGAMRVTLSSPASDVVPNPNAAPFATGIQLTVV